MFVCFQGRQKMVPLKHPKFKGMLRFLGPFFLSFLVFHQKKFFFPIEMIHCPSKNFLRSLGPIEQILFQKVQPLPPPQ